ncbi:MAG TPA: CsbD family protein [Casimicrobiaceae bacterium]
MNKDQVKGRMGQAGGKMKEMAGKLFGSNKLKAQGDAKQAAGKVQKNYGDAKSEARRQTKGK